MFEALKLEKNIGLTKYILLNNDSNTCYLIETETASSSQNNLTENINDYLYKKLGNEIKKFEILKVGPLSIDDEIKFVWPNIISNLPDSLSYISSWMKRARLILEDSNLYIKVESQIACKSAGCNKAVNFISHQLNSLMGLDLNVEIVNGNFVRNYQNEQDDKLTAYLVENKNSHTNKTKKNNKNQKQSGSIVYGRKIVKSKNVYPLNQLPEDGQVVVEGEVFDIDDKETRNGRLIKLISITDTKDSVKTKLFLNSNDDLYQDISTGDRLKISGEIRYDRYARENVINGEDINLLPANPRQDKAKEKRIELHLHTKMSSMDAIIDVNEAVSQAADWGHDAIAITDHGVAQAFPEAAQAGEKNDIKIIYGLEAYLVNDCIDLVQNPEEKKITEEEYVIFDLETTGLKANQDRIIEIGAVKISGEEIIDTYSTLVNPGIKITPKIASLTGIKNKDLESAPSFSEVAEEFKEFINDSVLVAHNISFDHGFIKEEYKRLNQELSDFTLIDTVELSRAFLPDLKSYRLNKVANKLGISLENHHRAADDAKATAEIFMNYLNKIKKKELEKLSEINLLSKEIEWEKKFSYHTIILAKNKKGLKDLYKLISSSHLDFFYKKPKILKSQLKEVRENLLIGSACEAGELYRAIINGKDESELVQIADFYDYLEIQPLENNKFLVENGSAKSYEHLKEINNKIYKLGKKLNKNVVATTDAHFLNPEDEIYRRILQAGQKFDDADKQPPLYFRTTDEMLSEFSYLGEEIAREVVIKNPKKINSMIEKLKPMPSGLFTPKIENADQEIREMTYNKAKSLYGEELPDLVVNRIEKELKSIINNGFSVIYLISHKLVKKSLEDGFLVGSRGSVGSSLVAYLCDITEVNPLPPHYRCSNCKKNEFFLEGEVGVGVDLEDKECNKCGTKLIKDGFDTPFEVFMGFDGNKVPDIDLNFSGEYQSEIHLETERLFGRDYVYRAGTISTIADRTAYGFVKGYLQDRDLSKRNTEINRLVKGCTGVKRTTGQHPGGLMVVPKEMDIHDFTPIQRPANDKETDVRTTHFDYHAISGRILKLDLLGHDDPTSIRMLQDLTGVDPLNIPLDDPETMSLFSGVDALDLDGNSLGLELGTLGIPEFGTSFVRQMLTETRPSTFAELVRISGLSHGTDVWLNNARDFIRKGTAELKDVISVRDDIMNYLIQKGLDPSDSFAIMEHVRKGKGLTDDEYDKMVAAGVPDWYIESCRKIKYMFPKAHAAAYVMMAFRIAYFKVNYPAEFYTAYFSIKADDFDTEIVSQGYDYILNMINDLKEKGNDATAKEKNLITVLEIVIEAMERNIEFLPVDLYRSKISEFQLKDKQLLPPLISVSGLGSSAAESLVKARENGEFSSIEDLSNRTSLSSNVLEIMKDLGALEGLPERDQLSLFVD